MNQIEKFPLESMDIKEDQISKLKQLFPEVFTEGNKIDWEKLKITLGEDIDVGKERFGLNWAGKSECFRLIQQPATGTLVPAMEESINFDTTENLFIEGDNLEVLKLLQKSYFGKVKMIYIDPPYNTGNDFVYTDDFQDNLKNYLGFTGQTDAEGKKLSTNVESDGRFHSNWLNMMYPRLFLAKNLLKEDGVIFISIDNHEFDNLKKLSDEIFGEENFISCIANVNNPKGRSDDKYIATAHEYLLVYKKQDVVFAGWKPEDKVIKRFNKIDEVGATYREIDLRKTGDGDRREDRPNMHYYFYFNPSTSDLFPSKDKVVKNGYIEIVPLRADGTDGRWRWELKTALTNMDILFAKEMPNRGVWSVFEKDFLSDKTSVRPTSTWTDKIFNSERGTEQFIELGFNKEVFPKPKPVGLIKKILEFVVGLNNQGALVLDFFAGSSSTAHGVLEFNNENETNINFICVQIPEPTDENSEAFKVGYKNIAEIGKERIRRVIKKIEIEKEKQEPDMFEGDKKPQDLGFKVFKLQSSNFATWNSNVEKSVDALTQKLFQHIDHISPEAEQDAILYELLLKAGFELTIQIEKLTVADTTVYSIMDNVLLICLERNLTHELLKAIAELKPVRFICLDEGFRDNDQLKSNAVLLMKENGVQKFQTV